MRVLPAIIIALAGVCTVVTGAAPPDLVQAKLLADVDSVKPGKPFNLGVLLTIKPGWHVYWKNPGDSGMATSVQWKLPDGFKAGELRFPIPVRFGQSGEVLGFGYHDELLLTATVTPPNNLDAGKPLQLAADVAWLVCEKLCIPGKAGVSLSLPVGDAKPANQDVFEKWNPRIPAQLSAETAANLGVSEFGIKRQSFDDPPIAYISWLKMPRDVHWFPVPPPANGVEKEQTKNGDNESEYSFTLVPPPAKDQAPMSFLVTYTDSDGKPQGVEFTVNLPPAKK
jgi:DsbC/DsbD-like thiol-disulfide interchange protein